MADTVGMQDIRGINVNKIVTGYALENFKMKQLLRVQNSSKWQERYFKETAADLTPTSPSVIKGVSRLATFPTLEVSWTQVNSYQIKHAAQDSLAIEDINGNDVDVLKRTLLRIARAIAKRVDSYIYTSLSDDADIETTAATGTGWDDTTSGDPIKDILVAQRKIFANNYDPLKNGYICMNPIEYQFLVTWLISQKGSSIPNFASEKVVNGVVGKLLGANLLVANAVTTDEVMYCVAKECGNYMTFQPLTTRVISNTEETVGIKKVIKSWEIGVVQVTNPKCIAMITDTTT